MPFMVIKLFFSSSPCSETSSFFLISLILLFFPTYNDIVQIVITNVCGGEQAKALVQRMKQDKRVNFKYDWKMVTIAIGGNDICSFICLMKNPESLPQRHRASLIKTLRYLKNNMPRYNLTLTSCRLHALSMSNHIGLCYISQPLFPACMQNLCEHRVGAIGRYRDAVQVKASNLSIHSSR